MDNLRRRFQFFWAAIGRGQAVIVVAWAAAGFLVFVQQEVLPPPYCDYRLVDLQWYEWAIPLLLLVIITIGEALYQYAQLPDKPPILYDYRGVQYAQHIKRGGAARIAFPTLVTIALASWAFHRPWPAPRCPSDHK